MPVRGRVDLVRGQFTRGAPGSGGRGLPGQAGGVHHERQRADAAEDDPDRLAGRGWAGPACWAGLG